MWNIYIWILHIYIPYVYVCVKSSLDMACFNNILYMEGTC